MTANLQKILSVLPLIITLALLTGCEEIAEGQDEVNEGQESEEEGEE